MHSSNMKTAKSGHTFAYERLRMHLERPGGLCRFGAPLSMGFGVAVLDILPLQSSDSQATGMKNSVALHDACW